MILMRILCLTVKHLNSIVACFVAGDVERDAIKSAFGVDAQDFLADLGRKLSRKKELEPQIRAYFEGK